MKILKTRTFRKQYCSYDKIQLYGRFDLDYHDKILNNETVLACD